MGLCAATWKLWTETRRGDSDVYLACRELGGSLKASLHQSGQWHIAYSKEVFDKRVEGALPQFKNRFKETWPRPAESSPGITLAYRIVTPSSAVTTKAEDSNKNGMIWIPNAPKAEATEIDIFIIKPETPVTGWPGKRALGTTLIGLFTLENCETVWAVYRRIPKPTFTNHPRGTGRFYAGASEKDLECENLRALAFGSEPDGSRTIFDFAVLRRRVGEPVKVMN